MYEWFNRATGHKPGNVAEATLTAVEAGKAAVKEV
jgi:hypothetical protein